MLDKCMELTKGIEAIELFITLTDIQKFTRYNRELLEVDKNARRSWKTASPRWQSESASIFRLQMELQIILRGDELKS